MSRKSTTALLALLAFVPAMETLPVAAQQGQTSGAQNNNDDFLRRAKSRVEPVYPDLARRMNISGTVKVEVVVLPNGTVKDARVVGGHPVLAGAAVDAARKWRFEPAATENKGVIEFKFEPQ